MLLRLLAIMYVLTGLVLVLGSITLGSIVVPVTWWIRLPGAVLPSAAVVLVCLGGVRLWRPTPRLPSMLRWTRMTGVLSLAVAGSLGSWGFFWMQAERKHPPGLLGGLWGVPLTLGVTLAVMAAGTWFLARRIGARQPEVP